jgi:hypothetical protein
VRQLSIKAGKLRQKKEPQGTQGRMATYEHQWPECYSTANLRMSRCGSGDKRHEYVTYWGIALWSAALAAAFCVNAGSRQLAGGQGSVPETLEYG